MEVALGKKELELHYVPAVVLPEPIIWITSVPPWETSLIDSLSPIVQVAHATLEAVPTGRASPRYLPNWQGSGPVGSLPPVPRQVYELVERSGVITAHALADALEMSHANAATVLLELYHHGLVDREPIRNSEGLHYSWRVRHGGSRK